MAPVPVYTSSPISTAAGRYTPTSSSRASSVEPALSDFSLSHPAQSIIRPTASQPTNMTASTSNGRFEPANPTSSYASAAPLPFPINHSEAPQTNRHMVASTSPPQETPQSSPVPFNVRPLPAQTVHSTIVTPLRSMPPAGVTGISTSPSYAYNSFPQPQPQDLSHPPGYQQDHHSSFDDKPVESCQETDYRATLSPLSASRKGAGILDLEWTFGSPNGSNNNGDNTVVKTAMSWAKAAGRSLSMTEKQIWKTINGEEDG